MSGVKHSYEVVIVLQDLLFPSDSWDIWHIYQLLCLSLCSMKCLKLEMGGFLIFLQNGFLILDSDSKVPLSRWQSSKCVPGVQSKLNFVYIFVKPLVDKKVFFI